MKQIVYIYCTLLLLCGCSKSNDNKLQDNVSKSYIQGFITEPKFEATHNSEYDIFKISNFDSKSYIRSGELFDKLCDKYGDNHLNYYKPAYAASVYADEFTSINITCDIDFDNEHPAGVPLADITMIHANSPYKYIKSGYKDYFDWTNKPKEFRGSYAGREPGLHPICKLISKLQPEDMLLLHYEIFFTFTKPRPEGKQKYTITLKTAEKTYSASCEIE